MSNKQRNKNTRWRQEPNQLQDFKQVNYYHQQGRGKDRRKAIRLFLKAAFVPCSHENSEEHTEEKAAQRHHSLTTVKDQGRCLFTLFVCFLGFT